MGEALVVLAALLLACRATASHAGSLPLTRYGQIGLVCGVVLLCMYCLGLYEPQITTQKGQSISGVIQAMGLTMLIIAAVYGAWPWARIDLSTVLFATVLLGAGLTISRTLFSAVATQPKLAEPVVVWGGGPLAAAIIRELQRRPDIGIRVVGTVDRAYAAETFAGVPFLGHPNVIWAVAESGEVRRVIVAVPERRGSLPVEQLMAAKAAGINFEDGVQLYEELTGKVWLNAFSLSSLVFSRKFRVSFVRLAVNRICSLVCSAVALIVASPLMAIIAVLIRIDSEGPIILRQTRVGENARYFTLFKFRSMRVGADPVGSFPPAERDDPRCTRVGKWIRRFRLDELPQLFNILMGDMYFVGPRPFLPEHEDVLLRHIPWYRQRWAVRPGATGWAQVHRGYCASIEDNAEKLSYDLFYIKNLSLGLDVITVLKTLKVLILGRGGR